jgi:DNA-binding Lrp family transcriptional regulator
MAMITMILRYHRYMSEESSRRAISPGGRPNDVQAIELDDVDRRILTALHADARMSNSALAELVGIAASTCHGRVRRLVDLGVIRGFYADIDPTAIGLTLQAMISVSLQSNARGKIRNFIGQIRRKPQVMDVYFLAGADDFLLHVAARDTDDLRSFVVENLNADADVAGTQTSLIFEHLRGASPL